MVMVWWWWCGGGWSGQTGGGDYLAGNLLDVIKYSYLFQFQILILNVVKYLFQFQS